MRNNCLSVLYKHIIQVENKNVGLKVFVCVGEGGHNHTIAPPPPPPRNKKSGGPMQHTHTHTPYFLRHEPGERKERDVLFNNALNTFYLRLYGVRYMVKNHSDSEKGNPLLTTWATLYD